MIRKLDTSIMYRSKDGNYHYNPYDKNAADTRYNQQQDVINELRRNNDLKERELNRYRDEESKAIEKRNQKIKEIYYREAIYKLELKNIDIKKLEKLSDLITEGDILIRKQLDTLDTEQLSPRRRIQAYLGADQCLRATLKWLGNLGLLIGLIVSIVYQTINIGVILILILLGYNFILDLGYKRRAKIVQAQIEQKEGRKLRPESEVREEEAKLNNLLEESKQKYEKDFEDFRYKNFNREIEELLLQLDYLEFKPLDITKVKETKTEKQQYSEYINNIR